MIYLDCENMMKAMRLTPSDDCSPFELLRWDSDFKEGKMIVSVWHNPKQLLPDSNQDVFGVINGSMAIVRYNHHDRTFYSIDDPMTPIDVTYWTSLPEPPKECDK